MDRELWLSLAAEAARDPSQASRIAGWLSEELRRARAEGEASPVPGYLYAGAHRWIARVAGLETEPLPPTPGAPPITGSSNEPIEIKTSFDGFIFGVSGWAVATPKGDDQGEIDPADLELAELLSCARDGRDLFSVELGLDGQITFGTDGRVRLMQPASVVMGAGLSPRALGWTVRRNQIITTRFRNLTNIITENLAVPSDRFLLTAEVTYHVINMERS
jgi:hypothetical protein